MQKKKTNPDKKIANRRKVRNPSFNEVDEKPRMPRSSSIRVGNISKVSGKLNIAGGNITTYDSTTGQQAAEIKQIFNSLYLAIGSQIEASPAEKEDLEAEMKEIQAAVTIASQQNKVIDEGLLSGRFRNIALMAPDILDVVVRTLANPVLGFGEVARKIAAKAKEEARAG
jgi:hypothetical protein